MRRLKYTSVGFLVLLGVFGLGAVVGRGPEQAVCTLADANPGEGGIAAMWPIPVRAKALPGTLGEHVKDAVGAVVLYESGEVAVVRKGYGRQVLSDFTPPIPVSEIAHWYPTFIVARNGDAWVKCPSLAPWERIENLKPKKNE